MAVSVSESGSTPPYKILQFPDVCILPVAGDQNQNARRKGNLVVMLHQPIEHIRYEDDEMVDVGIFECAGQFDFAGRVHAPIAGRQTR